MGDALQRGMENAEQQVKPTIFLESERLAKVSYQGMIGIEMLKEHLDDLLRWIEATPGGVFFVDLRGTRQSAIHRRVSADWIRRNFKAIKALAGVAILTNSAAARGGVQALLWLVTPPIPLVVFDDYESALAWCRDLSKSPPP